MRARLLGPLALAVLVLLSGCTGVLSDGVAEGADPAAVSQAGLDASTYVELNRTSLVVDLRTPVVSVPLSLETHVAAYADAEGLDAATRERFDTDGSGADAGDGDDGPTGADGPENVSIDVSNTSLLLVTSMSAVERGPVALNPLVYAADPAILSRASVLVEFAEFFLAGDLVDLTVEGSEPVTVLDRETQVVTLGGRLVTPTGEDVAVSLAVTRVVHEGDVVVLVAVAPAADSPAGDVAELAPYVVHGPDVDLEA